MTLRGLRSGTGKHRTGYMCVRMCTRKNGYSVCVNQFVCHGVLEADHYKIGEQHAERDSSRQTALRVYSKGVGQSFPLNRPHPSWNPPEVGDGGGAPDCREDWLSRTPTRWTPGFGQPASALLLLTCSIMRVVWACCHIHSPLQRQQRRFNCATITNAGRMKGLRMSSMSVMTRTNPQAAKLVLDESDLCPSQSSVSPPWRSTVQVCETQ